MIALQRRPLRIDCRIARDKSGFLLMIVPIKEGSCDQRRKEERAQLKIRIAGLLLSLVNGEIGRGRVVRPAVAASVCSQFPANNYKDATWYTLMLTRRMLRVEKKSIHPPSCRENFQSCRNIELLF